ncbi:MAG TPA: GNAT family N-acetyltransferase [Tepidisphaeraceae bacterium]|jgi:ribosomal-protein-alanine N-acetyltransferase|nr:GNAT family N-acetyltransferase [Tepidisphaeraceae bacterium]
MQLNCGVASIRTWRGGDENSLILHANDRDVSIELRDAFPYPYTRVDAENWIEYAATRTPSMSFAICLADQPIGGVGLKPREDIERCTAEIGYWIGRAYWGRGIATAVVRAFTCFAIPQYKLTRVCAVPFAENAASARVLEKAGYQLEARMRRSAMKEGKVRDQLLYSFIDKDLQERQ